MTFRYLHVMFYCSFNLFIYLEILLKLHLRLGKVWKPIIRLTRQYSSQYQLTVDSPLRLDLSNLTHTLELTSYTYSQLCTWASGNKYP